MNFSFNVLSLLKKKSTKKMSDYKEGGKADGGYIMDKIFGASDNFIVYLTKPDKLHWERNPNFCPKNFYEITSIYYCLIAQINSAIIFKKVRATLKTTLGRGFYCAVHDPRKNIWKKYFETAENRIIAESNVFCRWYYILFAAITLILFITFGLLYKYYFSPTHALFVSATIGGGLGAFLSVLLRLRTIQIPMYSGIRRQALHAITRTTFGACAGFVFAALYKGELIVSTMGDNSYAIFGLSIAAGFSERFVPNLLAQFDKQKNKN